MIFTKTATSYQIPLTEAVDVCDIDFFIDEHRKTALSTLLDNIDGVSDTEYNGHFRNFIYLNIQEENDNKETHDLIKETISNHIESYSKIEENGVKSWSLNLLTVFTNNTKNALNIFAKTIGVEVRDTEGNSFTTSFKGSGYETTYYFKTEGNKTIIYATDVFD